MLHKCHLQVPTRFSNFSSLSLHQFSTLSTAGLTTDSSNAYKPSQSAHNSWSQPTCTSEFDQNVQQLIQKGKNKCQVKYSTLNR